MLSAVFVIAFAVVVAAAIWARRRKLGQIREAMWATVILAIGVLMCTVLLLKLPLPNPVDGISSLFNPLSRPLVNWIMKEVPE